MDIPGYDAWKTRSDLDEYYRRESDARYAIDMLEKENDRLIRALLDCQEWFEWPQGQAYEARDSEAKMAAMINAVIREPV